MVKVKDFMKKHKKLLILLCILIVIAIGVLAVRAQFNKRMEAVQAAMNKQETALVEKRSLVSSISATGKVISNESKSITVNLSGVEIKDVNIEVGDTVSEGDVLLAFDSSDIEDSLADAKTSLNASSGKSGISVSSSQRSLAEAQTARDIDAERANQDVADAWNDYLEALTDLEEAEDDYDNAKQTTSEKKGELELRQANAESAKGSMESAASQFGSTVGGLKSTYGAYDFSALSIENNNLINLSGSDFVTDADTAATDAVTQAIVGLIALQQQYNSASAAYSANSSESASWQTKYSTAQSGESTYEKAVDTAKSTADSKLDAYNTQVRNQEDSARNNSSTVAVKEDGLKSDKLTATTSSLTDKQQVKQYETQLEDCIVKAPFSGVVTAVNVEAGDIYKGESILTIEDTSSYEVSAEIDEYDISNIELGQKVVIKTNGTGDAQLEGTVIDIAPKATETTGTDVTYTIKISVDTPNDDLRLDMTAKLSIILESKDNIMTVPYDAVQIDDEGKKYVEVVTGEAMPAQTAADTNISGEAGAKTTSNTELVYINTGIESDYYVEVESDELAEGMQVVVKAPESSTDLESIMSMRGPMGGF
ncbi:biotin/lipoyl-binding protein [Kineothrix alysoides]|uniref:Biotin/lipoyl-binding protein n=1 Tax=Kineothrix alysoides TaxID=1469948 RepID=A0A4R1QNG7_9FIRM|nr:HlyD family efflux transporter periplasmic adaptor subunit [Kineothrix alysoides]TCL54847.1 biotin/lipoyl-binding protein [Kineothrix alysoides]